MGYDYSVSHAASLALQLPEGSRTLVAEDRNLVWTRETLLAAEVINSLNVIIWALGGGKQSKKPKRIGPSAKPEGRKIGGMSMTVDELNEMLSAARGEVEDG